MKFIQYTTADQQAAELAKQVANDLRAAVTHYGRATLVVPGGSTPGALFDILAHIDLPWDDVTVMLSDERWVAVDSPRSNTALIQERLLTGPAAQARFVAFYNGQASADAGAMDMAEHVAKHLPISVLVLGMGADMHTASLFPGAAELAAAQSHDAPALTAMTPQDGLEPRVTLSQPALQTAAHTHLLIKGDDKRAALDRASTLPPAKAPVAAFLSNATVHWTA